MLEADLLESSSLRSKMSAYFQQNVDDGSSLVCASGTACRDSVGADRVLVEGQGIHVGVRYALRDNRRALRILVVPKQVGGSLAHGKGRGTAHVTVDGRSAQVESAKFGPAPHPRTGHMSGTALALKTLLGLAAGGPEMVKVGDESVHVFDCFAMANATLCSKVGSDASGQGSSIMFANCTVHLARTIQILSPNVVIAQGWDKRGSSPSRAVSEVFGMPLQDKNSVVTFEGSHGRVAFVSAVHPSRNWSAASMAVWRDLEPVFAEARAIALGT